MANENLGPAERIIQTILAFSDHLVHNRPGYVVKDLSSVTGLRWSPATTKLDEGTNQKIVFSLTKSGKKSVKVKLGTLQQNNQIKADNGNIVGDYRKAGLFPEVAVWMYRQVAEIWKLDNEFAARWASYAYKQEHRDLKVVLAAFMLVQSRRGDAVLGEDKSVLFRDEDFRLIGEAMMLLRDGSGQKRDLNPRMLLRIHDVLTMPSIASINRELGFGRSARRPFTGRWVAAVEKWLMNREQNPKTLESAVKAGYRTSIMELCRKAGYKPETDKFFQTLRWKQHQAEDGRRSLAIGKDVSKAESWEGLSEEQICQKIVTERLKYTRVTSLVPGSIGITRAIMAATIDAGGLSDRQLIILTPTLEELGLLEVQEVRARWERATRMADDMRAANIATRVKSQEVKDKLQATAEAATQKAVAEMTKGLVIDVIIDVSGSMQPAIQAAKGYLAKLVPAFPPDKLHVSIFNTAGREISIPHPSAAGVEAAFRGIVASGGTAHGEGVRALSKYKPGPDEDLLLIFVGDQQEHGSFEVSVQSAGLSPVAFGFLEVKGSDRSNHRAVQQTAANLGVPCLMIDEKIFADPYAIPRTLRALVASTPVGVSQVRAAPRATLVDQILKTDLLAPPPWAFPGVLRDKTAAAV